MADGVAGVAGRVVVVTGGYGVLGSALGAGFARAGARVAVLGRRPDAAEAEAVRLRAGGADAMAVVADVLDRAALEAARDRVLEAWGRVDVLVNAAGGNVARARNDDRPVFEVPLDAFDEVLRLNLHGAVLPTMVFGESMAGQRSGCVLNISSMAALQALSGVMGYSAAKAGIDNVTRWLAVDLARRYGDGIRVNAIAPGFFLTEQNRAVLVDAAGEPTPRARTAIARTPMGRLGRPQELVGAALWLCGDDASFVTGVVVPVDGGFSAFSGV
jgi:NAD(P)-dependent dehydrogenase (short-subunit alcohol dehydrogenase family)